MKYSRTGWINDTEPAINATNLSKIEYALQSAIGFDDLDDIRAIPATIAPKVAVARIYNSNIAFYWESSNGGTAYTGSVVSLANLLISDGYTGSGRWVAFRVESEVTSDDALYNCVVSGETNGTNSEFEILGAKFNKGWSLFVDGVRVTNEDIVLNGNIVTLATPPVSGSVVECLAPHSDDYTAPNGFKTIGFVSDKNGTIEIDCTVTGSTLPQWKVGDTVTEGETFSYVNDGEYVYIYLYVPDESSAVVDAESQDIYLIDVQENLSAKQIKLQQNAEINYSNSLSNLIGLDFLPAAFASCGIDSFPVVDFSEVTNLQAAFFGNNLSSFPLLDISSAKLLTNCWRSNLLVSFPLLDYSAATDLSGAWYGNYLMTSFPANSFDNSKTSCNYSGAWVNCALDEASVDGILVSINTSGANDVIISLNGGTNAAPSATGLAAKSDLESRGCTVNTN